MQNTVKFVNQPYDKPGDLQNLLHYAMTDKRTGTWCEYTGGINTVPLYALDEMMYVKRVFRKTEGRQLRHIIVSPDTQYYFRLTPQDLYFLALRICTYYSSRYQIVFGVHTDTRNIHIHFIMNTVSYVDGMMYSGNAADMNNFKAFAEGVIIDYCTRFNK